MITSHAYARLGTRGSTLARWQTQYVSELLQQTTPGLIVTIDVITTYGDQTLDTPLPSIGGKGVFTADLEQALHARTIDVATHSLKDLPTELPQGLTIGAIPERANPADVLVSRQGYTLETLPPGATVGTSSQRRRSQLLSLRPDLHIVDTRGNIDTRIRKAMDANRGYDAIMLAYAGLQRLHLQDVISQILPVNQMIPAPGQGALGIQCRNEAPWLALLGPLHHQETALAVAAERAFLTGLGGGCAMPIGAYAYIDKEQLHLRGCVCSVDGSKRVDLQSSISLPTDPALRSATAYRTGVNLACEALEQGAAAVLETVR